jgi:hypothetical protein
LRRKGERRTGVDNVVAVVFLIQKGVGAAVAAAVVLELRSGGSLVQVGVGRKVGEGGRR